MRGWGEQMLMLSSIRDGIEALRSTTVAVNSEKGKNKEASTFQPYPLVPGEGARRKERERERRAQFFASWARAGGGGRFDTESR